jgi:hypothetical protein
MQNGTNNKDNPKKGEVVAIAVRPGLPLPWLNRAKYTVRGQWWDTEGRVVTDVEASYELGQKDGIGWGDDPTKRRKPDGCC